ncbi:ABC transporter ATP-binding protein [Planctomycetota bacterium]
MPFIEVSNLTKHFKPALRLRHLLFWPRGKPIKALDNIRFQLDEGKILGLVGANGAGKSTLLKIISTLVLPDSGTINIGGVNAINQPEQAKQLLSWVSGEERSLYWRLSGRANLEFFAAFSAQHAHERINELLQLLEIERPEQRIAEYSTGMKHRLNLARGLLANPRLLLLDEPTKSLDPSSSHKLRQFIKAELAQQQKKTIIMATHNLAEAESLCDVIGIIDRGEMKFCGRLAELRTMLKASNDANLETIYRLATKTQD